MRRIFPVLADLNPASLITTTGILAGLTGCYLATHNEPRWALIIGSICFLTDIFDGIVARRTQTTTPFGAHLDSMADATGFCLLPMLAGWALGGPTWGTPLYALYALCGLLRLARFGVVGTSTTTGQECFEGLPTTMAASLLLGVVAIERQLGGTGEIRAIGAGILALLMISRLAISKRGALYYGLWGAVPVAVLLLWRD